MSAVCRVGDTISGTCAVHGATTGVWPANACIAKDTGINLVLVGYTGVALCGHTFTATNGSLIATVSGIAVHRIGDAVAFSAGGVGVSVATLVPTAVTTALT